jgi:hypothetical protein
MLAGHHGHAQVAGRQLRGIVNELDRDLATQHAVKLRGIANDEIHVLIYALKLPLNHSIIVNHHSYGLPKLLLQLTLLIHGVSDAAEIDKANISLT